MPIEAEPREMPSFSVKSSSPSGVGLAKTSPKIEPTDRGSENAFAHETPSSTIFSSNVFIWLRKRSFL
mgnify:CR=1 FL=1